MMEVRRVSAAKPVVAVTTAVGTGSVATANNATNSTGGATTTTTSDCPRFEKSLGLLTSKFVALLQEAEGGVLDLKLVRGVIIMKLGNPGIC